MRISDLDSEVLATRLNELLGDERNVQVEFLLHLEEFDRRRQYESKGYGGRSRHSLSRWADDLKFRTSGSAAESTTRFTPGANSANRG